MKTCLLDRFSARIDFSFTTHQNRYILEKQVYRVIKFTFVCEIASVFRAMYLNKCADGMN